MRVTFVMLFLALPTAVYLGLAFLPRGRVAWIGIAVAALIAGLARGLAGPEDGTGFQDLLSRIIAGAVGLAAVMQGLGLVPAPGGRWYPPPVAVAFPVVVGPLVAQLGV